MTGGRAVTGGVSYQAYVAAYCSVLVLAEGYAARLPAATAGAFPVSVWCETEEALDDIELRFSDGKRLLMQAKRGLGLERGEDSQLGKACRQLVAAANDDAELAIVVDVTSKSTVTRDLSDLLDALRTQPYDAPLRKTNLSARLAHAQDVLVEHLRRAWRRQYGKAATAAELRRLIARTRILVLDVEGNGGEAREAESLLRANVVADVARGPGAWTHLLKVSLDLARRSSGIGRPQLQSALLGEGIALQAAPSVRADTQRLIAATQRTLRDLRSLARIEFDAAELRIDRELPRVINAAAEQGSVVVVGEPGIGKSGALHAMAMAAQGQGRTVVALAAEEFDSATQRALADELRLEHDIADVLSGWPEAGLLVIDGLDAGSDKTRRALAPLMRRVADEAPRWHVVASIRTFDLRNDASLPARFPIVAQAPIDPRWTDPEFRAVRHIRAGRLTDDEIDQLAATAPDLHQLVTAAPDRMRELARVPFNLRLLAQLAETVAGEQLQRIDSQVGLLEAYWRERVLQPSAGRDARERLLRDICEHALTNRRPSVPRSTVRDGPVELLARLEDVLRNGVLVERAMYERDPDGERLAFAHNVLFDYAVERLLLRGPGQLVKRLASDRRLLLRARPSIDLHMRWLWNQDTTRCAFWCQALSVAGSDDIGELPKTIAPAVLVDLARNLTDFDHLVAALDRSDPAAHNALTHTIGALTASTPQHQLLTDHAPWPGLLKELTDRLTPERMWIAQRLMLDLADQLPGSDSARYILGHASRKLLTTALEAPDPSPVTQRIVEFATEVVCKTFATAPDSSEKLLRRLLEPARVRTHGHWQLFRLTNDIGALAATAPAFVGDVYRATLGYRETSSEATPMLASQLMPMRSSRAQDYDMARHNLAEEYRHLLEADPAIAIDVLDDAVSHMAKVDNYQDTRRPVVRFQIADRRPGIRLDGSYIWEGRGGYDEPAEKMLSGLDVWLTGLATDDAQAEIDAVAAEILSGTHNAALWRVLLRVAAHHPTSFTRALPDLLRRPRIHLEAELEHPAGQALASIHPLLSTAHRKAAEQAVIALPRNVDSSRREFSEHRRDELLQCSVRT